MVYLMGMITVALTDALMVVRMVAQMVFWMDG